MKYKFKIGDKIVVIGRFDGIPKSQIGKNGTIADMTPSGTHIVFDEEFLGGNTANGNCPSGFGYNMWGNYIDNDNAHKFIQLINGQANYEIY